MANTRGSGSYDWKRPPEPPGFAKWVADHRILTRIILFGLDTALVVLLVTGISSGDNHWYSYFQLVFYGWLTWNFGWITPKSVDDWRSARRSMPSTNQEQTGKHDPN